jgi:NADH-quinone oxidoreductase subunit L
LTVIAWVGGLTALLAGVIAVQQNDIKRILAFSTISQLAYMVMAVGLAAPTQAMFHLTTHAFFKALLFLGAGAVIYVLHHEQDIWRMGGLRKKMPLTFWTFLIGALALSGVPPFSGFYSKDEILAAAYAQNPLLFALAVLVAALTALYMFRLIFVAFLGAPRTKECAEHAREAPDVMTWPLLILAVPSALAGFWGIEHYIGGHFGIEHIAQHGIVSAVFYPFFHAPASALFGVFAAVVGISAAYGLYAHAGRDPLPEKLGEFARFMRNKFYFDEIYGVLIAVTHELLARLVNAFDRWIVSGLVIRGLHGTTDLAGRALRLVQTGNLQTYAFLFAAGVALLLYFVLRS